VKNAIWGAVVLGLMLIGCGEKGTCKGVITGSAAWAREGPTMTMSAAIPAHWIESVSNTSTAAAQAWWRKAIDFSPA
jgi:hypothetical protein